MKFNNQKHSLLFAVMTFALLFTVQVSQVNGQTKRSNKSKKTQNQTKNPVQKSDETSNWFTFTGVDEEFSLKTPINFKPITTKRNDLTTARQYGGDNDKITLSIVLQEMGLPANNPYIDEFAPDYERITAKLLREGGFEVISFRRISPNTVDWEQWNPNNYHTLSRHIVKNARLYSLSCTSNKINQEVDRKLCRVFFNSFKFLD